MRYRLDSMLPLRAFTPRSGRARGFATGGMTLEGGGDSGMAQWQIDAMQPAGPGPDAPPAPAPEPQGSVTVESAPASSGGGGGGVSQDQLNQLYQQYLGRGVDPSGAQTWAGQDINTVIAGITGSQEYANRGGGGGDGGGGGAPSGGQDINALYQQYLNRPVDPSGAQTYAGWSSEDIKNAILNSPEYAQTHGGGATTGGGTSGSTDINALYQQYLNRNVDPQGAATWAGQTPEAIIAGITGSQEYQNLHPGAPQITGPAGDPSTWEVYASKATDPAYPDNVTTYYKDPKTGNIYDSQTADAKLVAKAAAINDPYIKKLDTVANDPVEAQKLYDLKQKDPNQFYDQVATQLKDQAFTQYWTNSGSTSAYDQLQSIKDVNPQAYYKNQLDFLGKQVGWQYGQNTSDRAAPVLDKIKQVAAEAQGAGISYDDVNKIVNTAATFANIQNQQRIANEAATGGSGFNFGKDVMPGVAMIAVAAATVASGGAATVIGEAVLGAGAAGATALGGAVVGAGMGALTAAATGGNVQQAAIRGAVGGAVSGAISEVATANNLVGTETVQSIADATNLRPEQVAKIITNTAAMTVSAAATGQVNGDNFAQVVGTSLASSAIGAYSENVARAIDPEIGKAAISAVSNISQIATNAALNGHNIQNAIIANIPNIVSGAVAADRADQGTKFNPYATENVGLTSGAVDRTLTQGLIDPYVNDAQDPIAALNAQQNWTGNALDNIRYSTNVMIDQSMPKSDIIANLASIYNVDEKAAEGYYQNTLANNAFERIAAKAEDPIALLNAAKLLTGDKQENLKYVADEMKRQGLAKSEVSTNLQDLFQVPKDKADAYASQLLSTQAEKKAVVQQATTKAVPPKLSSSWDDNTKIGEMPNPKIVKSWDDNTKIAPMPNTPLSKTWEDTAKIPSMPEVPKSATWEDTSAVPRFDLSTTWTDNTKLQPAGSYTWDEAGKIPALGEPNFPSRLASYLSTEAAPTIQSIQEKIPTFEQVQKSFMDFVEKPSTPNQPSVIDAAKDVMNALVDAAKTAPQVAQMVAIKAVGDTVESFSSAFLSPLGRQNAMYLAGKAISDYGWDAVSPEVQNQIKDSLSKVDTAIKNAEPGMKEITAVREYIKNPLAFVYRGGPEAVQDLGFLGMSKLIGVAANVMTTFDAYKASLTADLALNYLDSALSGAGRSFDQLKAKGVDDNTATALSSAGGAIQGVITMTTHGIVDAAILKRLAGDVTDFTGKGIAAIGGASYAASYVYTFINNIIDQLTVNPNQPIDYNKANIEAATNAPISAISSINAAAVANLAPIKSEVTVSDATNVPLLKAPESQEQYAEAPKLLQGPMKLLAGPEQVAAVNQTQNEVASTLQQAGIAPDQANVMANKAIGSELVDQINSNIPEGEAKLNPNKVLGTAADGTPITFADVFGSLATDKPIIDTQTGSDTQIKHNETLVKDIKAELNDLLGVKLDENALVAQTQKQPLTEQQKTEGLPFKEPVNLDSLAAAFNLKNLTLPSTQTSTQTATAPATETQTQTQMQTVNPTATATATDILPLVQPLTQTQTLMQPVNPTPTATAIDVLDPTKLVTTIAPKSVITPSPVNVPVTNVPVDTTTINPIVPVTPVNASPKTAVPVTGTTTKKKKVINPPDLFADFAKGRKWALPIEKRKNIIDMNEPSNVIPMENYINPLLNPKTLEEELKSAREGGLMHLATGGGTGGANAGATPGSNIGIGPGDMAYSPVANFVKGAATKPYLPEKYDLQMFNYTPTVFNPETALKQILAAADGGPVHMADGGEPVDPGPELRIKGQKFSFHKPFTGLNLMANAPQLSTGGEVGGHNPQFFSEGGLNSMQNTFVKGAGDGTSDSVPAMLANGEFVIPADVVSALGNGSNDSGASVLDQFLKTIRAHKTKAGKKGLPPDSKGALGYLLEAKRKVKK